MNCNECECMTCVHLEECGGCGMCDSEHPHAVGCPDWENDKGERNYQIIKLAFTRISIGGMLL